ncbi:MAG: hypothetical protein K6C30_00285 [Bacteroidaceae bacterium]|nr:hypothetical protein [Bacteroidaceae bacterium]
MKDQHERAGWHDYSEPGVYMITIVAERRGKVFGQLEEYADGKVLVRLSPLGAAVEKELNEVASQEPGTELLRTIVMPDHVHFVIKVQQPLQHHLGTLIRRFKYATTLAYLRLLDAHYGVLHRIQNSRPSATQRKAAAERAEAQQKTMANTGPNTRPNTEANTGPNTEPNTRANTEPSIGPNMRPHSMADEPPSTQPTPGSPPSSPSPQAAPAPQAAPTPSPQAASSPFPQAVSQPGVGRVGGGPSAPASSPQAAPSSSPQIAPTSSPQFLYVPPLWSKGYHDRILYGRHQLSRMLHYVSSNPRRGWIKHQHPHLFYNHQMVDVAIPLDQARWLLLEARHLGIPHELQGVLHVEVQPPGTTSWQPFPWWQPGIHASASSALRAHLHLKMTGNLFLLDESLLLPIRVSRSIYPSDLRRLITTTLKRCEREGAVVTTPGVSPGEEAVMFEALHSGYRAIHTQATSMSDVAAPSENLIPYVAQGRLLLIAPWPNRPQSARPHKELFELLNAITKVLCNR